MFQVPNLALLSARDNTGGEHFLSNEFSNALKRALVDRRDLAMRMCLCLCCIYEQTAPAEPRARAPGAIAGLLRAGEITPRRLFLLIRLPKQLCFQKGRQMYWKLTSRSTHVPTGVKTPPRHVKRLLEVENGKLCYVVGTVYVDMPLKPNVLEDLARDVSSPFNLPQSR